MQSDFLLAVDNLCNHQACSKVISSGVGIAAECSQESFVRIILLECNITTKFVDGIIIRSLVIAHFVPGLYEALTFVFKMYRELQLLSVDKLWTTWSWTTTCHLSRVPNLDFSYFRCVWRTRTEKLSLWIIVSFRCASLCAEPGFWYIVRLGLSGWHEEHDQCISSGPAQFTCRKLHSNRMVHVCENGASKIANFRVWVILMPYGRQTRHRFIEINEVLAWAEVG